MIEIVRATDMEEARALFREYAGSLEFSLEYQHFSAELAGLPGSYAPPGGALLIARADGIAVGIVALRRLDPEICEMKRLYVQPAARAFRTSGGISIGRALAVALVDEARARGYRRLRLDTVPTMVAAIALYRSLGFVEIAPYYGEAVLCTVFMQLAL
ncbi:MAG: GNAT family N-acetyltransferase [Kofleriaceae bacterium]